MWYTLGGGLEFAVWFTRRFGLRFLRVVSTVVCLACLGGEADGVEWPMLGHDAGRSGATSTEVRPPFERKWYRLFGDEGLMAGVQPIVAEGNVFVGTMAGRLYAIDSESGADAWTCETGGAILHTCAAAGGKVFFGNSEGRIYAVNAADGTPCWNVQTGSAVWNAPLVHDGIVVVGSRDGRLYAAEGESGGLRWAVETGGAVVSSPAMDVK